MSPLPKVHSIDWSYAEPHSLVTASNDCTVKFHNVQGKVVETLSSSLSTSVPVWRARLCKIFLWSGFQHHRFTPFGDGMVTVLVPHFGAHEHSLFLWNTKNLNTPVHTFVGHRFAKVFIGRQPPRARQTPSPCHQRPQPPSSLLLGPCSWW